MVDCPVVVNCPDVVNCLDVVNFPVVVDCPIIVDCLDVLDFLDVDFLALGGTGRTICTNLSTMALDNSITFPTNVSQQLPQCLHAIQVQKNLRLPSYSLLGLRVWQYSAISS